MDGRNKLDLGPLPPAKRRLSRGSRDSDGSSDGSPGDSDAGDLDRAGVTSPDLFAAPQSAKRCVRSQAQGLTRRPRLETRAKDSGDCLRKRSSRSSDTDLQNILPCLPLTVNYAFLPSTGLTPSTAIVPAKSTAMTTTTAAQAPVLVREPTEAEFEAIARDKGLAVTPISVYKTELALSVAQRLVPRHTRKIWCIFQVATPPCHASLPFCVN